MAPAQPSSTVYWEVFQGRGDEVCFWGVESRGAEKWMKMWEGRDGEEDRGAVIFL